MIKARYFRHLLHFKTPSGTSRGVLYDKETWFLVLEKEGKKGIGECGLLRGLSFDDRSDYEQKLAWVCSNIGKGEAWLLENLMEFPSIQFGVETAFLSLQSQSWDVLFASGFSSGLQPIPINGLIWMGDKSKMLEQINDKIALGFSCLKLKIGALDFEQEIEILRFIRSNFSADQIEIRVDANGGFDSVSALNKLEYLSGFEIHSIEQPIAVNQHDRMAELCKSAKLPIALDEELIGMVKLDSKVEMLDKIKPQFLVLKPSFIGGFRGTLEWIELANERNMGWWITSALESNIGLNAIAQFTASLNVTIPQGLGTGALYTNNYESPLVVEKGNLWYSQQMGWKVSF